jgi:hypothetical protein
MTNPTPAKPKVKMFGLIRDKYGKPKIDGDPNDLHPELKKMLSNEEKLELGIE